MTCQGDIDNYNLIHADGQDYRELPQDALTLDA